MTNDLNDFFDLEYNNRNGFVEHFTILEEMRTKKFDEYSDEVLIYLGIEKIKEETIDQLDKIYNVLSQDKFNSPKNLGELVGKFGKCVVTYYAATKTFGFHIGDTAEINNYSINSKEDLLHMIEDSGYLIGAGLGYHREIERGNDEGNIVGGGSIYIGVDYVVIAGESGDYGKMHKDVIRKLFQKTGYLVYFGDDKFLKESIIH